MLLQSRTYSSPVNEYNQSSQLIQTIAALTSNGPLPILPNEDVKLLANAPSLDMEEVDSSDASLDMELLLFRILECKCRLLPTTGRLLADNKPLRLPEFPFGLCIVCVESIISRSPE